jgi:hypothetical protein
MTVETLTIQPPPDGHASLNFEDVRERAGMGECDGWAVACLTLVGGGETFGEFLDLEDVEKLHAWTGKLLAEARGRRGVRLTSIV